MHLDTDLRSALVNQFKWGVVGYVKLKVIIITLICRLKSKNI
jgi:hypothetical protein